MDTFQQPAPGTMNPNPGQMTPDMMQALLQGQQQDPRAMQLTRQQAMADQLRKQSMQQPGLVDAGRAKVAPWGQIGANMLSGFQAQRMQPGIDTGLQQVSDRHTSARQGYADALSNALRRQSPQQPVPGAPPAATMSPDGFQDTY